MDKVKDPCGSPCKHKWIEIKERHDRVLYGAHPPKPVDIVRYDLVHDQVETKEQDEQDRSCGKTANGNIPGIHDTTLAIKV
jgi:hypothetical protein